MRHILGPNSCLSNAILVRLLLAMAVEIWNRECGPFRPVFADFAILGQVGNTLSPWRKGPRQKRMLILVAYD